MLTERFLRNRTGIQLTDAERRQLEAAIVDVRTIEARRTVIKEGEEVNVSTLLLEGFMARYIDDRKGLRQLVAIQVPGEFVDLHAYPMKRLDHNVGTLTPCRIAIVPHAAISALIEDNVPFARKLWFSTLIDAAMHRAWIFRIGRLDAVGRVAHFLSEMNCRLEAVELSDGQDFTLEITQADLAEACGLTSVHVNRVIRQLREMELCVFRASRVRILDRAGLERRGNFDPHYLYLDGQTNPASKESAS